MRRLEVRRHELARELDVLDAEINRNEILDICGENELQDVELYDGTLGVPRAFVDEHEPRIGQIQWLSDLGQRFNKPGNSPGNVAGERWGSGGLIPPLGDSFAA